MSPTDAGAFDTIKQFVAPVSQDDGEGGGGGGGLSLIIRLKAFCADCCGLPLSCTRSVTVKVPAVVGVPLITPVDGSSVNSAGKVPALMFQDLIPVPPVEANGAL